MLQGLLMPSKPDRFRRAHCAQKGIDLHAGGEMDVRVGVIDALFKFDAYLAANAQMMVFDRCPAETMHEHHSIRLVAAFDGPVRLREGDGRTIASERFLIPPLRRHALLGYEGKLVTISFDHRSISASAWDGKPITGEIAQDACLEVTLRNLFEEDDRHRDVYPLMARWIETWTDEACPSIDLDARVATAKRFIDDTAGAPTNRGELARSVGLSPSRFAAIFSMDTGTSLRRYLAWRRLVEALRLIGCGESVTGAAFLAGFSDGAHLTRTSRSILGMPPSRFIGVAIRGAEISRRV